MSKLLLTSDLHLGHNNITKYRTQFSSADEHHNFVFENLATNVGKRDTVYFLGDVAFDKYWLEKIKNLKCQHKKLILGNHDSEHHTIKQLANTFDSIESLLSKRNVWFSHCPIHPQEMRGRLFNVHGHCVDMETEILTLRGWKKYDELVEGEEILSVDPDDHRKIIVDKVKLKFKKKYTGNMLSLDKRSFSMRVTDEHRVPQLTVSNKLIVKQAKDSVNQKHLKLVVSGESNKDGVDLSNDMLSLYIAIAADGNVTPAKLVRFLLSKVRKVTYVETLLTNLGIAYKKGENLNGIYIHFRLPSELEGWKIKGLDYKLLDCSKEQAEIIRCAYRNTDGNRNVIFTSKESERDILSLVFIQNGYKVTIHSRIHGFGDKLSYSLSITDNKLSRIVADVDIGHNLEFVEDEEVWCVETNSSFWFAKRKSSVYLTGNCHNQIIGEWVTISRDLGAEQDIFVPSKKYVNVCLEHTNYKPISFAEVKERAL